MLTTHAVGIDLGTTYSCIAYLNEHGEPVTLPNQEGELSTPSVVLFEDDEVVVGTEALRNSIARPDRVIQNSKRHIGDPSCRWVIDNRTYTPIDIAAVILRKMIDSAEEQIGKIEQAVITVPAQFSDIQRQATVEAGHQAGLKRVDIINEPVAAALCYVLGTEGLWFTELADEQRILVYDLGGGTFDLSLVKYEQNEVSVITSTGDLQLGGIDWNRALENAICDQFKSEYGVDPRSDPESLQFVALEAEQTKRSLTVRPKAAMTCQHGGHRKTYQVEQNQFEQLTQPLVTRTTDITVNTLKENKMGWAHVDVVLTTGGASRMPMIRDELKKLSGRTLNTSLSPDQSIAHGATYYAGMLLTNSKFAKSILDQKATQRLSQVKQKSVNARGLGIFVRDMKKNVRVPHYIIPANTPLPASFTQKFGTVRPNQKRVHLQILESGALAENPPVRLGSCVIDQLGENLPVGSEIEVTITYNEQARVQVSAKDLTSGNDATAEIFREENVLRMPEKPDEEVAVIADQSRIQPAASQSAVVGRKRRGDASTSASKPHDGKKAARQPDVDLEDANEPIPLCNHCGDPLDSRGQCRKCEQQPEKKRAKPKEGTAKKAPEKTAQRKAASKSAKGQPVKAKRPSVHPLPSAAEVARQKQVQNAAKQDDIAMQALNADEIMELGQAATPPRKKKTPSQNDGAHQQLSKPANRPGGKKTADTGEEEFWNMAD